VGYAVVPCKDRKSAKMMLFTVKERPDASTYLAKTLDLEIRLDLDADRKSDVKYDVKDQKGPFFIIYGTIPVKDDFIAHIFNMKGMEPMPEMKSVEMVDTLEEAVRCIKKSYGREIMPTYFARNVPFSLQYEIIEKSK